MSRFKIIPFDVDTASPEIWAAVHVHRRAITAEFHPDEPVWSDADCEYEMRRPNPLWESHRWMALDGRDVVGFAGASFRRAGAPNAEEHARYLNCHGDV